MSEQSQSPESFLAPTGAAVAVAAPTAYCIACGKSLDARAAICPACGVPTRRGHVPGVVDTATLMNSKSAGVAILLSLIWPGAGQWYAGETGRGFAFSGGVIAGFILMFVLIGFVVLPVVWIWAAIDANKCAERFNARLLAAAEGVA